MILTGDLITEITIIKFLVFITADPEFTSPFAGSPLVLVLRWAAKTGFSN
jgi:hypothetical protein